jgi:hypothetical protein
MIATLLIPALLLAPQDEETTKKIDALIRDLGAEDFETREKASAELRKIGKPAVPALRKAAESEDAEVKMRAKAILEELEKPAKEKPKIGIGGSRITVKSVNGDTSYIIVPSNGDAITLTRAKDGAVQLDYTEAGQAKTAKAESLAKFLETHPELAKKYGISEDGIDYAGARASFKGGGPRFHFDFNQELPDFTEEMERLRKLFEDRDWGWDRDWTDPDLDELLRELRGGGRAPSAHGASFSEVDEVLRAHLEIPEGTGLVVRRVKEDSLAAKLGLKKNDIVLEVDGTKVSSTRDVKSLLKKDSTLQILRGGKRTELKTKE